MSQPVLSPIALAPYVVVFDYGEVISVTPTAEDSMRLQARAGVRPENAEALLAAYVGNRLALDKGTLSVREYWRSVGAAGGVTWSDAEIDELWALDVRGWMTLNPGTLAVLHALKAGGTRLALLSNAGRDFASWFRHGSIGDLFEQVFVSGELDMVKPNADIYEHVIAELGIEPSQFVFIDNREDNVEGARAVGGQAHVFTDASSLESWLRELAVPVNP